MDINEELKITIEDVPEIETEDKMDYSYELNTMLSGEASIETDLLQGELCCVILQADKPVSIKISLLEFPDIILLDIRNFIGSAYMPLKALSYSNNGELLNYSAEEWILNNQLKVEIKDNLNANVKCIFRVK